MQSVTVKDYPTYKTRSLLVDTARHYLPLSTLKRQINGLALAKMNILHLHIIDDESSAFAPATEPAKAFENAAYYHGGWYRTFMDTLKELSAYAHSMGIYIMVEVDMPGHAASWRLANANLTANCPKHEYSTVNPLNDEVYAYIQAYISDLVTAVWEPLGQTPLLHLGGDEVDSGCWDEDAQISAYMAQNGLSTTQLWQQFHSKVASLVPGLRVYWQESFENGNDMTGAVVESWYDESAVVKAVQQGIKAIRAAGWYLDQNQPGASHYSFQDSWQDFYAIDPMDGVSKTYKDYVLGGEAAMWGEKVHDGNIDEFVWPRTVAIGEVLWSSPSSRTINDDLKFRFNMVACKLQDIGIAAGPFRPSMPCPGDKSVRFN